MVCAGLVALLAPLPRAAAGTGSSDSADDTLSDYTKDQVVYVKADAEGDTQGIYVVNAVDAERRTGRSPRTGGLPGSVENLDRHSARVDLGARRGGLRGRRRTRRSTTAGTSR